MSFCACCDFEFPDPYSDPFPESCPECGARFEHEGEVNDYGDLKASVGVVRHGAPCYCRASVALVAVAVAGAL
jgi:hypothetical protein